MCWNKEVSFATFISGTIINGILWRSVESPYFKAVIITFEFALLMQLVEGFLWIEKDVTSKVNNRLSIAAFFINILQPIIGLLIGGIMVLKYNKTKPFIPLIILITTGCFYLYYMLKNTNLNSLHVTTDETCHLNLSWWSTKYSGIFYSILLYMVILFLLPLPLALTALVLIIVFQTLTYLFYSASSNPSLWCFFVTIIPLILFLLAKTKLPVFQYL